MSPLTILRYPDPRLHTVAKPVASVDERIRELAAQMLATMYEAQGIGLAATQVNVHERLIVIDTSEEHKQPLVLINPEIVWASEDKRVGEEGCLSVPGLRGVVPRHARIRYSGFDPEGRPIEREADGFHARVVQHECDHLWGMLYPMRMTDLTQLGFTDVLFPGIAAAEDD
jgi:peptide deformylase